MDVRRSATKLRLVTGTYSLQANRPAFNQHFSPTCLLCKSEPETREHFICSCSALEKVRQSGLTELQEVLPPNIDVMLLTSGDLLQLLLNCRPLMASVSCPTTRYAIESVTRRLCYRLHNERFTKLNGISRRAKVPLYAIQGCVRQQKHERRVPALVMLLRMLSACINRTPSAMIELMQESQM